MLPFCGLTGSPMDLHTCLAASLEEKYQLKEAFSGKVSLPLRVGYQNFMNDLTDEHELRYLEKSHWKSCPSPQTTPLKDIFTCDCKHDASEKTIITLGLSGVGKTTLVQTCILEWAKGNSHHDVDLLFPFTFWELNLLKGKLSVIELIQTFYPDLTELDESSLNENNVCFIFDGLDQYHLPLNFKCPTLCNLHEKASVDILVTNLIRGNLLPTAHIWITARNAALTKIPRCYVLKETEVQGFSDKQKEQHFRTVIGDDAVAKKVINHVKISRSLDSLCQIPPVCTIMANVLRDHLKADTGFKISPLNLTQIYSKLIKEANSEFMGKLKKLALHLMGEGDIIFPDLLLENNLLFEEASAFSKEHPLVLREEKGLHDTTVFCFGHTSIREFLAASYKMDTIEASPAQSDACQHLVDQAIQSPKERWDGFLRFIFGLIKERGVLEPSDPLFEYTKKKIVGDTKTYSSMTLFHCLREYDSLALLSEIKFFQKTGSSPIKDLTPVDWACMIQKARVVEGKQDCFVMQVSTRCDENFLGQLFAVLKSRTAKLQFSNLTDTSCPALAGVLGTRESYLRELNLGYNNISDDGVMTLVGGLTDQNCKVKLLNLQGCGLTSQGCRYLATTLGGSLKLQELDLSGNDIGDDGMKHLAKGLRSPECWLEVLKVSQCNFEKKGCRHLAIALKKNPGHLKVLDLSINMIGDEGASDFLERVDIWTLTKLKMYHCGITYSSCKGISEALKHEDSTLVELDLSSNHLKDAGFLLICEGMYAWCALETLNVSRCGIGQAGGYFLSKVLWAISQLYSEGMVRTVWQAVELTDLDLSLNPFGDNGVNHIASSLRNPYNHIKTLNLSHCGLTDECCAELASGFGASESDIYELDLSHNNIKDKGVKRLCLGLCSFHSTLQKLSLASCGLTSRSVQFLTTALKSNPHPLAELHLMGNSLVASSVKVLKELTKNPKYSLIIIDVSAD